MSSFSQSGKIDSANAAKIRQANIANLVKKLKSGKTLTSAELRILEESEEHGRELVTLQKVLDIFGVTRKTISLWRKEGKDVPDKVGKKEDLAAWRSWFASNPDAGFSKGKPRKDRESLLCAKLELEIETKKLELEKEQGNWVAKDEVEERDIRIASVVKAGLLKLCNDTAPMVEGLEASKIHKVLMDQGVKILEMMADEQSEFWKEL